MSDPFTLCDIWFLHFETLNIPGPGDVSLGNKTQTRLENLLFPSSGLVSKTQLHILNEIIIACSYSSYNNNNNNNNNNWLDWLPESIW